MPFTSGPAAEADGGNKALLQQLEYFQGWLCSLTHAPLQAVALQQVHAAAAVVVSGFVDTLTAEDIRVGFEGLIAAHHAAVAPGPVVTSCKVQPGTPVRAVLQLRCAAEASNSLALDGLLLGGTPLKVERPQDYCPEAAVLLGPTEPNPAVCAAVARSKQGHAASNGDACGHAAAAAGAGSSFAAAVRSAAPHAAAAGPAAAGHLSRVSAPAAYPAGASPSAAAAGSSASSKGGSRDLVLPADQSKQDEVFIGGLPSHWKAQQLKELLAPYGQLKSLSVAMDAATGKNKGYAFVVFASPDMVAHAIEELDCKVVEGKILAVQRATEGKATYGRDSSGGGNDTGSLRDGGSMFGPQHQHMHLHPLREHAGMGPQQLQQPQHPHQQQHPQQLHQHGLPRHHHHRSSSTGSALPPHLPGPVVAADTATAAAAAPGPSAASGPPVVHNRNSSSGAPAPVSGVLGPAPPAGPVAADASGSMLLGPRPPPGPPAGAAPGAMQQQHHSSGPSSAKQYDVNELYIGDLPLTWDEDAVRRLLGRFGRIKYFTLRNGRDKNFAFCKFKDSSVVDAAIAGLHGKIVDGYFLNVRRAIEGKQQAGMSGSGAPPAPQPWLAGKQGPPMHQHMQQQQQQQQQQQPNVRASFDATSTRVGTSAHRPRMSADQQQLSKLAAAATAAGPPGAPGAPGPAQQAAGAAGVFPGAGAGGPGAVAGAGGVPQAPGGLGHPFGLQAQRGNVLAAGGAAGHQQDRLLGGGAGRLDQQQQQGRTKPADAAAREQQQLVRERELERGKAPSPAAAGWGAAGAAGNGPARQHTDAASGGSTGPSTPGTPTTTGQEQQQQQLQQLQQQQARLASAASGPVHRTALEPTNAGLAAPALGYGSFMGPQLLQRPMMNMSLQQQQQQQLFQAQTGFPAAPVFPGPLPPPAQSDGGSAALFGPNGPASWPGAASLAAVAAAAAAAAASPATTSTAGNLGLLGAPAGAFSQGLGLGQKQQQQQMPQQQQQAQQRQQQEATRPAPASQGGQSLLQTWDMLSPWSLFSHTAQ